MSDTTAGGDAGSEAPATAAAEGSDAEALSAAAAVAPEALAAAPEGDEVDLDADPGDDLYSDPAKARAYAEKLRKEAASHRVKAKENSAPFDGWNDADAQVWKDTIQIAAKDPKVGAEQLRKIATLLEGGKVEEAAELAAEVSEEAAALTPEDVEAKVNEALAKAEQTRQVEAKRDEIISKAKGFGYNPDSTEAADRADYFTLLHLAQFETGGDLDKAHEVMEARKQAAVDAYIADVKNRAAGQPIHGAKPEDSVIDSDEPNDSWASASKRTKQRLINLRKGTQV